MLTLARRILELTVGGFALLGFLYVPIGGKSGLQHAKTLWSSPLAREAVQEVAEMAGQVQRALEANRPPDAGTARVSARPTASWRELPGAPPLSCGRHEEAKDAGPDVSLEWHSGSDP